ncbi:pectate lyase [Xanthomonas codiaei]|uniref:pectin lyase n=1 Tax=Xanthomonas codiaei TaxID=56463 RepID=A0A2S7CS56_9XANT|nr:pectate lyase [Xanthomonas codiaei]
MLSHSFRCALSALALAAAMFANQACAQAVGTPDGFAAGVTGGGDAPAVRPGSLLELQQALCSSFEANQCTDTTPRVIVLDRTFDFTGSQINNGSPTTTTTGCVATTCSTGTSQLGLNVANYCAGRTAAQVSFDTAGRTPLQIGSNKTLIGLGSDGAIMGRGLRVGGGNSNVIIQNITISDINPGVVWGGDALAIDDADGVWVDHNRFARIGRQMVVTGYGSASHVTLSNNEFDGRTATSSTCDNRHYWLWLFLGAHDTITVARNYVHHTSGRGPHAGGLNNASVLAQMVNNYFEDLSREGAAMPLTSTALLLLEGNYFSKVSLPVYNYPHSPGPGYTFAPFAGMSDPRNDLCVQYLGRECVANDQIASGSKSRPLDEQALAAFGAVSASLVIPASASSTASTVRANAGVGKIN